MGQIEKPYKETIIFISLVQECVGPLNGSYNDKDNKNTNEN